MKKKTLAIAAMAAVAVAGGALGYVRHRESVRHVEEREVRDRFERDLGLFRGEHRRCRSHWRAIFCDEVERRRALVAADRRVRLADVAFDAV